MSSTSKVGAKKMGLLPADSFSSPDNRHMIEFLVELVNRTTSSSYFRGLFSYSLLDPLAYRSLAGRIWSIDSMRLLTMVFIILIHTANSAR